MDLINKLPYFYDNEVTKPIIEAEQVERDILLDEIKGTLEQCFVSTATWGLDYWEKMLCIPTIKSKSYEERRSIIYSKMRGTRTTTIEVIRQIAMSFFEVENVEVIENNSNYEFNINLINANSKNNILIGDARVGDARVGYSKIKTITINLADINNVIELYKPAHLNYYFTFTNAGKIIINSTMRSGSCELPICNITKVGTWWKQYADGSIYENKVIQAKSFDGFAKLPICGLYKNKVKNAIVAISTVGSTIHGGD